MAATVGALRVTLGANTANFEAGMRRAKKEAASSASSIQRSLASIKGGFAGLGAGLVSGAVLSSLAALTKRGLDYAASLGEVSQQLGVTTKDLQVWRYAATQNGISTEEMDKALQKFTKSLGDARNGSQEAIKTFKAIGFTDADIKRLDVHDALLKTADGIAAVGDRATRATPEVRLFGRAGQQLDTVLSQGAKGVHTLAKEVDTLGLALSDKQIQDADRLADKLDQLKSVLEVRIAGVVADNASSIYDLANALEELTGWAITALGAWAKFVNFLGQGNAGRGAALSLGGPIGFAAGIPGAVVNEIRKRITGKVGVGELGTSVTGDLGPVVPFIPTTPAGGGLGNFLAGGGRKGGGGRSAQSIADEIKRKRIEVENETYARERDISDAKREELQAQRDLVSDYVDRQAFSDQLIDLEAEQREAEIRHNIALAKIEGTYNQEVQNAADFLLASNERLRTAKKLAVNQDVELDRQRDFARLQDVDFDIQRQMLDQQLELAETQGERRDIELRILDVAKREEQAAINRLAASEDWADREEARRRQIALNAKTGGETELALRRTRGPLEEFQAGLPTTAAKMNEALQLVATDGLKALEDGILSVIDGTKSLGAAFRDMASQIIADLLRIQIQRAIIGPLSNLLGSAIGVSAAGGASVASSAGAGLAAAASGFASGGFTGYMPRRKIAGFVHGQEFVFDADATNRIGRDNLEALRSGKGMAPAKNTHQNFNMTVVLPSGLSPKEQRETGAQFAAGFQARIAAAKRKGF